MTIENREKHARGKKVLDKLGWGANWHNADLDDGFWDYTLENNFGTLWARPGLSLRDREMITLAVLIALGPGDGILPHFRSAHHLGLTETQIREIIFQTMYYAGWSRGSQATRLFNRVLREPGSKWPQPKRKGMSKKPKPKSK